MDGLQPRQLHVFDNPTRDDRGWALSVAHIDVIRVDRLAARFVDSTRLAPVDSPGRLLGDEFTMLELRLAHEAIAGRPIQRDWFRRTMEPQLVPTGEMAAGTRGRPAELFRRRS